jgi:hypothetical protein
MRKGLMAGVIGAAAIAAVSLAPSASADSAYDNYRYIQGLNNNGIYIINTNVAINTGHNICTNLASSSRTASTRAGSPTCGSPQRASATSVRSRSPELAERKCTSLG